MRELTAAQQACNNCGEVYEASLRDNPTNPLCTRCVLRDEMIAQRFSISAALADRQEGRGLMARMSDERFTRYIMARLRAFHALRNSQEAS